MSVRWIGALGLLLMSGSVVNAQQEVAPPRSFEAIAISPTEIRCYWLPSANAASYRIERDGKVIATPTANAQEFDDTGLTPDSTHRYVVRAVRDSADSSPRSYTERTFTLFPTFSEQASARGKRSVPVVTCDIVVAQASSGGVAAAIEAGRRGYRVALIEPTTRVGGMPVNGLSATDLRRPPHASGFLVRFRDRVQELYAREGVKASGLAYEPRVAHQALKSLLYEAPNVTLYRRVRPAQVITRDTAPQGRRRRIESLVVEELDSAGQPTGRRAEFRAGVFIDATDCGDLAAWAGAPFRLGREARSAREPHNGVIYYDRAHDKALPGSTGIADKRIQSYAYLLTVKDYGQGVDKTIPMPPGYRKEDFIHAPAWKESWAVASGSMPNGKFELNQHPQGNDLQEINYRYPTDDYSERARIEKLYHDHILSYLYYIQTEQGQKQLGLPDDEYRDTAGFPPLLYVREGRRIVGEQLPDEKAITDAQTFVRPESMGLGDYPMDSHAVERKTNWSTPDMGEGEWWLYKYTPWHELPLGVIVPKRLDNVFVTTAVSSTHVSFGTYRLEPVRMAFGQAAAIAATLCLRYHLTGREVPARQIQEELLPHMANPFGTPENKLTYFTDVPPETRHYRAIQYMAAHGFRGEGEEFKPDAPTTVAEFAHWLLLLAQRYPGKAYAQHRDTVTFADPQYAASFGQGKTPRSPVTRAEMAIALYHTLPGSYREISTHRYSDISDSGTREAADALLARGLDSRLWEGWDAYAPDGSLLFRPEASISHSDLFQTLYVAQIGLGPLFFDNPFDGRNGRKVPPDYFAFLRSQDR